MIKPLRKKHVQVWLCLALLLPVGIVLAWLYIPNQPVIKLLIKQETNLLPNIHQVINAKCYTALLRSNKEQNSWQLEWKNNAALTTPSAVIYKIISKDSIITSNELIGRIEATGDYIFTLKNDTSSIKEIHFKVYDFIHEVIIDSLNFKL